MSEPVPYDEWADLYDVWVARAPVCDENLAFYADWLVEGDPAVELGVGNGRITVEVARRGGALVGVDSSTAMLDVCRARVEAEGLQDRVTLLQADFRDFTLPAPASRIAMPFHTVGHLLTPEDKRRGIARVFGQLAPGGLFLFDHFVFDEELAQKRHGVPFLEAEYAHPESGRDAILWVTVRHDIPAQRIRVLARTEELDARGETLQSKTRRLELSWLRPEETRELLEGEGFRIEALWGDFDRAPFGPTSREQVWLARKPS